MHLDIESYYLLFHLHVEELDLQISCALEAVLDDQRYAMVISIDGMDPSIHHELHGIMLYLMKREDSHTMPWMET